MGIKDVSPTPVLEGGPHFCIFFLSCFPPPITSGFTWSRSLSDVNSSHVQFPFLKGRCPACEPPKQRALVTCWPRDTCSHDEACTRPRVLRPPHLHHFITVSIQLTAIELRNVEKTTHRLLATQSGVGDGSHKRLLDFLEQWNKDLTWGVWLEFSGGLNDGSHWGQAALG